jgi:hypothetical protein
MIEAPAISDADFDLTESLTATALCPANAPVAISGGVRVVTTPANPDAVAISQSYRIDGTPRDSWTATVSSINLGAPTQAQIFVQVICMP